MFLILLVVVFIVLTFLGYITHRFIHSPKSGRLYISHCNHHSKQYPADNLISEKYRDPGKDNTVYIFLLLFSPIIVVAIILTVINLFIGIYILIEMAIISIVNNYLHNAFHLKKSIWHKFPGFKRLREQHFVHHKNVKYNFGIFSFVFDKMFGTFKK